MKSMSRKTLLIMAPMLAAATAATAAAAFAGPEKKLPVGSGKLLSTV